MQLHLSQTQEEVDSCADRTGLEPAELLDCHGIFSVPATATDCACLSDAERQLLGKRKASAVAAPVASAKAGKSSTPISECVKAGMNVAFGTGGAAETGSMDLFETMRWAVLSSKNQAAALPAPAALMMATVCGARAQGRAAECGMLKEGMDADLALVDFSAPHLMPCHNVMNSLVFSATGSDVALTMVRGQIVYRSGSFPTLDLQSAVQDLMQYALPQLLAQE